MPRQPTYPYSARPSEKTTTDLRNKYGGFYCTQAATTAYEMLNVRGPGDYRSTSAQARWLILDPGSYDSLQHSARTDQVRGLQQDPDARTATYTAPRQLQQNWDKARSLLIFSEARRLEGDFGASMTAHIQPEILQRETAKESGTNTTAHIRP